MGSQTILDVHHIFKIYRPPAIGAPGQPSARRHRIRSHGDSGPPAGPGACPAGPPGRPAARPPSAPALSPPTLDSLTRPPAPDSARPPGRPAAIGARPRPADTGFGEDYQVK